ncbi:hypothetical protein [Marinimicrobium sp. LS-A18]|uniref:hypothetical protein n=1 Tax=Marinimicrobium sp. LS-A18 TaxID=1381596 RepID=UPI000463E31A|nr:hypothetical protein [Marinimicrobium sp. LS-A18]
MTQVGEGVAVGGGRASDLDDLDDNHWLELEYRFQSGRAVYGYFRATDSDGMVWVGRLNDQGQVCLAGLPPGNVRVTLLPEPDLDARIEVTRASIKEVLDQIIEDQRLEAEAYERELEQMGGPQRVFEHIQAVGRGAWNGAVGFVEFVGKTAYKVAEFSYYLSPANLLGDTLRASYQSYQDGELTWSEWYDSVNQNLQDEQKKDLARLFGVEPDDISEERLRELMGLIAEAYDIAAFIADDAPTREMLLEFAQAMADNQSSVEWAEFAGAGVFEIVLAALLAIFTAGAGNAAQAASQLRHASRLRSLGHLFRNLARQLRRKKLSKSLDVPVDQKTSTSTDQPSVIELKARSEHRDSASIGSVALSRSELEEAIVDRVGADFKNNPLRKAYEEEVVSLSKFSERIQPGMTIDEKKALAIEANDARRALGIKYKNATPEPLRDFIYDINTKRYDGDPLGPTVDFLVNEKGKSYTDIIKSASRPNPDVDKLLSGFSDWLKEQPEEYILKYGQI